MKNPCNKVNEKAICRILVSGKLNLHCSKFNSPSNLTVDRYFEPHWVPVCSIEHLEQNELLCTHFLELSVHNQIVSFENIRYVVGHLLIYVNVLLFGKLLNRLHILLYDSSIEIVVLWFVSFIIPQIVIGLVVSWNRDIVRMTGVSLLRTAIVNAGGNYIPSYIPIWYFSFVKWCSRSQS